MEILVMKKIKGSLVYKKQHYMSTYLGGEKITFERKKSYL